MALSIKDWLEAEEKDYGIGLAILGTHSKNRILLQNLGRKKNMAKLEYELRKIAKQENVDLKEKESDDESSADLKNSETTESHSDQVIEQMNADKLKEIKSGADEIVSEKLQDLESDAEDIVSESRGEIQADAEQIIDEAKAELETIANEIISGKLKIIRDGKEIDFNSLSAEMKARWEQNRDSYKEIRVLHEKLKLLENATPEDRQPLTQRMCDLDDLIRDNWAEIDAFVPGSNNNENSVAVDHKRIQANRKYISTNLKKLPEVQDPVKVAKMVTELQLRFDEIKAAGETVSQETIDELTKAGVKCQKTSGDS